jgi:hypothetical protein
MVRIIRIAGALIAFFVTTGFVGASHGGDVKGSNQGSDTAAISASGMTAVRLSPGIRDSRDISGFSRMYRQRIIKNGLASVPCSDNTLRIFT